MKNKFDLMIFDWDGTLVNSIDWIVSCLQQAAAKMDCNIPTDQAAKDVIGLSLVKALDELFPDVDTETKEQLIENYRQRFFSRQLSRNDLFPGVFDMLVELKQAGFQLAVATGKTRAGLDKALASTGTKELFNITRCADETDSKPAPKMIREIIDQLAVANHRSLMIGDSVHDLQMAANAGISSVAVTCGVHTPERLEAYKPLCCLTQATEILDLI